MAMTSKEPHFTPLEFTRHAIGDNDILIDIMYSGICHSDIHMGKNEWRPTTYPFVGVPEIAGRVAKVGKCEKRRYGSRCRLWRIRSYGRTVVGLPATENTPTIPISSFVYAAHRKVYGSLIGGIPETQEMLDYSVANNIYPEVEIIPADKIDQAYQNIIDGKVKFRYVIDMSTLKSTIKNNKK